MPKVRHAETTEKYEFGQSTSDSSSLGKAPLIHHHLGHVAENAQRPQKIQYKSAGQSTFSPLSPSSSSFSSSTSAWFSKHAMSCSRTYGNQCIACITGSLLLSSPLSLGSRLTTSKSSYNKLVILFQKNLTCKKSLKFSLAKKASKIA